MSQRPTLIKGRPGTKEQADEGAPQCVPDTDPCRILVPYTTGFRDLWRGSWYVVFHDWQMFGAHLLVPLIFWSFAAAWALATGQWTEAVAAGLSLSLGWELWAAALLAAVISSRLDQRRLRYGNARGNLLIGTAGVEDRMPGRTLFLPWSKIRGIREHHGDIYFLVKASETMPDHVMLPKTAFVNREAAQNFHSIARMLHARSSG